MSEANVVIKGKDLLSKVLNSITNANKGLSKSQEEAARKAEHYNKTLAAELEKLL